MALNGHELNSAPLNGAAAIIAAVIAVAFVLSPTIALLAPSLTASALADSITSITLP